VAYNIKFTAQFNGCGFDGATNACVACVEIGLAQRTFEFSPLLIDHGQADAAPLFNTTVEPLAMCYPVWLGAPFRAGPKRLDSEQFRFAPRTCGPLYGRLMYRKTERTVGWRANSA